MKLVVAIDDKLGADTATEHILKANYGPGLEIHLVHVMVPGFADAPAEGIPDVVAEERQEETAILNKMAQDLREKLGANVVTEIINGETADVIADVCKRIDADEALVPSHARHGFSRLWFGSAADDIVHAAPCTVVVLKIPQEKKA